MDNDQSDLDHFYEVTYKEFSTELTSMKEALSFGLCVSEDYPYEYWVGMCKAYRFVLDTMKRNKNKMHAEFYGDDDE